MTDLEKIAAACSILDKARWGDSDFENVRAQILDNDDDDYWAALVSFDQASKRYHMPVSISVDGKVEIDVGEGSHIGDDAGSVWMWLYYQELSPLYDQEQKGMSFAHSSDVVRLKRMLENLKEENSALREELDSQEEYTICDCCESLTTDPVDSGGHQQCRSCTKVANLQAENAALRADHEKAVSLVIDASIATGNADTSAELMAEVLHKVGELRAQNAALRDRLVHVSSRIGCGCGGDYGLCKSCEYALEATKK